MKYNKKLYHVNDDPLSHSPVVDFTDSPSLTKQQFLDDCNIHRVLEKFEAFQISIPQDARAFFGDISDLPHDFGDFVDFSNDVSTHFGMLPAEIRADFSNDPVLFYDYVTDPDNRSDAIAKGFLPPESTPLNSAPASMEAEGVNSVSESDGGNS